MISKNQETDALLIWPAHLVGSGATRLDVEGRRGCRNGGGVRMELFVNGGRGCSNRGARIDVYVECSRVMLVKCWCYCQY